MDQMGVRFMEKGNLVDIKSILFLLTQYLNRSTEAERVFFALEISRIFAIMDRPKTTESEPPRGKVKMV